MPAIRDLGQQRNFAAMGRSYRCGAGWRSGSDSGLRTLEPGQLVA